MDVAPEEMRLLRLNFSKTVLECSLGTDKPVVLAEFEALRTVRRSANICCYAELSQVLQLRYQQLTFFPFYLP